MSAQYLWRPGSQVKGLRAQVAGEAIEEIRQANGGFVRAGDLVEAARPEEAPLHPGFEWDDAKAAELYREAEARNILRSIAVVAMADRAMEEAPRTIRAFVSVTEPGTDQRGYTAVTVASADDAMRREMVERAWQQLKGFQRQFRDLQEFSSLWATLDRLEQERLAS